jgi:hypothetical protein
LLSSGPFPPRKPELALELDAYKSGGLIEWDSKSGTFVVTNGVQITYGDAVLGG